MALLGHGDEVAKVAKLHDDRERVKAGMARAKAQGKRTSRPPIPEATRRKIAELHAQGMSIKRERPATPPWRLDRGASYAAAAA